MLGILGYSEITVFAVWKISTFFFYSQVMIQS